VTELFEVSVALQAMNSSALLTLATKKITARNGKVLLVLTALSGR
jgi:hypothetical protein